MPSVCATFKVHSSGWTFVGECMDIVLANVNSLSQSQNHPTSSTREEPGGGTVELHTTNLLTPISNE